MDEGGKDRLFLSSPSVLPKCQICLVENHDLYQESSKQKANVNLVLINQNFHAFIFKYAINYKFSHFIFGCSRESIPPCLKKNLIASLTSSKPTYGL